MSSPTAEQLCRRFSLADIHSATGDFSEEHVIGRGGFGKVYRGLIDNGSVTVAIKRLAANSDQGEAEFESEMKTLTKFRHRNLVSLIGYCSEQEEMILVYEYMRSGTLADHLYKPDGSSLSWNQRLKICIGAARGLDYLHSGCSIIHRDVKSTNILLDENLTAKVSDFGLAKHLSADMFEKSYVMASVKGSFGYFDPSYFTTGRLTKASDTYAFGVMLLEVLSGRPAIEGRLAENELCMRMWAQEKIRNGKAEQIVAANLKGEVSQDCLKTFVGVAKRCLHDEPKKRLTMNRAVVQLELALEQQEKITNKLHIWPFWNRVVPSGSTQKDENEDEVDQLARAIPAIQEDDDMPISVPAIQEDDDMPISVPAISAAEIKDIIDDFNSKCFIAKGFVRRNVFHGVLKSGQDVAVKNLYKELPDKQFKEEVSVVSSLKHENVVELVGYCLDGDLKLKVLVSEFAPRGSLYDMLHCRTTRQQLHGGGARSPALSWAQRIKIAVGVASGLCYIHDKGLIHHNIKSSNVLLFDDEIAKIDDLRLSTQHPCSCNVPNCDEHPHNLYGHLPPEYERYNHQTRKGDVYSFGVVLLELLTGRNPVVNTQLEWPREHLVSWARPHLSTDKVHKIVDARLERDYPLKAVQKMFAVAALCVENGPSHRPDMRLVVRKLQRLLRTPTPRVENS